MPLCLQHPNIFTYGFQLGKPLNIILLNQPACLILSVNLKGWKMLLHHGPLNKCSI